MNRYSQRDPRWASQNLGTTKDTIADYGCYVTSMAMMSSPAWLTPVQILLLDAGLLLTLYVGWRVARQYAGKIGTAAALVAPWAVLSAALYATGVWILFQPMQMRGMLH